MFKIHDIKQLSVGSKPGHGTNITILIYDLGVHEGVLG